MQTNYFFRVLALLCFLALLVGCGPGGEMKNELTGEQVEKEGEAVAAEKEPMVFNEEHFRNIDPDSYFTDYSDREYLDYMLWRINNALKSGDLEQLIPLAHESYGYFLDGDYYFDYKTISGFEAEITGIRQAMYDELKEGEWNDIEGWQVYADVMVKDGRGVIPEGEQILYAHLSYHHGQDLAQVPKLEVLNIGVLKGGQVFYPSRDNHPQWENADLILQTMEFGDIGRYYSDIYDGFEEEWLLPATTATVLFHEQYRLNDKYGEEAAEQFDAKNLEDFWKVGDKYLGLSDYYDKQVFIEEVKKSSLYHEEYGLHYGSEPANSPGFIWNVDTSEEQEVVTSLYFDDLFGLVPGEIMQYTFTIHDDADEPYAKLRKLEHISIEDFDGLWER